LNGKAVIGMSESTAKKARKEEAEKKIIFRITIDVHEDGGFGMEVPKGASMVTALDVLMKASQKVFETFVQALQRKQAASAIVRPVGGIPEGLLRREPS